MDASEHSISKDQNSHHNDDSGAAINLTTQSNHTTSGSQGTSIESDRIEASLNQAVSTNDSSSHSTSSSHSSDSETFNHISPDQLKDTKTVNSSGTETAKSLSERLGRNGDFLDPGGGTNTVIASQGNDIILGNGGGFNTITTGNGQDLIVLGRETTNRVFDFNPDRDQFGVADALRQDLLIGQGQNPTKGGIDQPLDSENNAVIVDRSTEHILASLTFTDAGDISDRNFVRVEDEVLQTFQNNSTSSSKTA
ncbi:hypothetical protein [Leptolyngbya sp. NIES-2104]|uniref:hypothetical protein n=1 Tax=Leptolyngbya sp. NIES-2104 TaxID=1552121 RepID=UPI0006ECA75C|nr:hypothetical protein [Leptolyngbya sp. NIES-2104]GAP99588.1 hypothetical protein NIES2104_61540 [Leptolyngbya sp. NIES-2104]